MFNQYMNKNEWHSLRAKNIGASEIAALFGEHDYLTKYKLWNLKAGLIPPDNFDGNDRINAGNYFEPAIAAWASDKFGMKLTKYEGYCKHPAVEGMGCSPDYVDENGAPVQIKYIIDWNKAQEYTAAGDELADAPLMYILQVMHEISCMAAQYGYLIVCLRGERLLRMKIMRRDSTIKLITDAVTEFWSSIKDNNLPHPDYAIDAAVVSKIRKETIDGETVDLSACNRLNELCAQWNAAVETYRNAETAREAIKAEIFDLCGTARKVKCGPYEISMTTIADGKDTVITQEMVGQVTKGRAGYRKLNSVKEKSNGK